MRHFRGWIASCLTGGLIAAGTLASAETRPVVVELFTSQGCSSCPPADAFLHRLTQREDVIALALHVDYWDYIGWEDSFAQPAFTQRQKNYARAGGRRSVYTPQMIIAGVDHVIGTHEEDAKALIARHAAIDTGVTVTVKTDAAGLATIEATADAGVAGPLVVQLVRYLPRSRVEITRGENAGREIEYANVVTEWSVLAEWNPGVPLMVQTHASGDAPGVVILQGIGEGPIVAAARLR